VVREKIRGVSTEPLHVISSMATRELLRELARRYESATGQAVVTEAAGGVDVAKRVERGDALEVVVLASDVIDRLIVQGKLRAGSRKDLVKSGAGVAVRAGAAKPDISTEDALRRAVLAAKSLSYSTGPSGTHLEKTFARWGVLEELRARIVVPKPGTPVARLVADGTAEIGFQQLSELMNVAGVEVLGPLPGPVQTVTIFSGGVAATSRRPEDARVLLEFLAAADGADLKRRYGMEHPT
jgi:molybdate transport system substrate-binding protein